MRHTTSLKLASLLLATVFIAAGCTHAVSDYNPYAKSRNVVGGTLRVDDEADVDYLDTADGYYNVTWALERAYARELYSWSSAHNGATIDTPVPDLATSYTVNANDTVWTFNLRPNVRWSPPVNRDITAQDFITAVERMYDESTPSGGQTYSNLIAGAEAFGEGTATTISGMKALSPTRLQITLTAPTADFLSIVALPFFAPVPAEYAKKYAVGAAYSMHVAASGPYMLQSYHPDTSIVLVRNPNWNPATDPLRSAHVGKIVITEGESQQAIQTDLESGSADISLDSEPPVSELRSLVTGPMYKQFADEQTGCESYFALVTNPTAGPIGQGQTGLDIRRAINDAIDKVALQSAVGGPLIGNVASTILTPELSGYQPYDLYPSAGNKGNVAQAKALLAQAGYPNGLTLHYAGDADDPGPAVTAALRTALARAGISLDVTSLPLTDHYTQNMQNTADRVSHQIGVADWCPDYPGSGGRSYIPPLLYGPSITSTGNTNYAEFNDPHENTLIAQALVAPTLAQQSSLWGQADRYAMTQAAWAPFLYDRTPFFWSARVRDWTFSPWVTDPDIANLSLSPTSP